MPRYAKKREYEEDDSGEDERVKSAKKIKGPGAHSPTEGAKAKDAEGNPYWEVRDCPTPPDFPLLRSSDYLHSHCPSAADSSVCPSAVQ